MDHEHSTTTRRKGKHLTFEERMIIEIRHKDHWSAPRIAREIGCSPNTIRNEIKRGTEWMYHGKVPRYKAEVGQKAYEENRKHCCRHYDYLEKADFLSYVEENFQTKKWSLDACRGEALRTGAFSKEEVTSTKTLYNYVDLGLLKIKNIDLPDKLRRRPKKACLKENKKILGRSIEERPSEVNERNTFGNWEADLVIGSKSGEDKVLLTLLERKSRAFLIIPLKDRKPDSVMHAFEELKEQYREHFSEVFKTITTDNGSEFSDLAQLEKDTGTLVYFAHPYTSWEKGSIERFNGLIRRFIRKGRRIDSYSLEKIAEVEEWVNGLPRKILDYQTPVEIFEVELDRIYQLDKSVA